MRRPTRIPKLDDAGEPGSPRRNVDYAAIGAANGPQAVGWEALRRGAQSLMNQGLQDQAQQAAKDGAQIGAADGAAAFDHKRGPILQDDGTVFGQARDNAMMTAYLTRLDLSSDELALELALDHKEDPDGFRTRWDKAGQAVIGQLPPEFREPAQMEWARKGLTQLAPITRARADRDLAEANAELVKGMDTYQTQAGNAWRSGDLNRAAEFDQKFRETLKARTDLDPRRREAELLKYEDSMRRHNILGNFDQAKKSGLGAAEGFIKGFADPKTHPQFDPDSRDKLVAEMTRDLHALKADRAVAVTQLHEQARTALTLAQQGYGGPDQLDGLIGRARGLDPKLAAGLTEARADIVYQADIAKLPPAEIAAQAGQWKAQADGETDLGAKARAARRHQAAMAAFDATGKALASDPLTHAARQGLIPLADFDPVNPDRAALDQRLAMRDNVKSYFGLNQVGVLTEAQAGKLAASITQAAPEAKADILLVMADKYGKAWPDVYGQLVKHKLPPEFRVLATMDARNADMAIARVKLAEAYHLGDDALKASIDKDKVKNIDGDLPGRLAPLRDSLTHAPNGPALMKEYNQAAKMLAYQYARTMDWDEALKKAVNDVVLSRYDFISDDTHNVRAPAGTSEAIKRQAERQLDLIKPSDLAPVKGPAKGGLSEAQLQEIAHTSAKRGKWVTNESDDGWVRLDSNGNPVMLADGRRLEMPFAVAGIGPR